MKLQDVIRIRRAELNLTLEQIAQACGVGRSILSKWERGVVANLRMDNIKSLAVVLHISPLVLLGCEDFPAPPSESDGKHMEKGECIRFRRNQLGISQTALSEMIGESKQAVHKYENDIISNIPSQFFERLAYARKERGYTQVQLAEAIGVAKSTYAGYENGTREPDFFKLKKLISFLHVDSSWLLGLDSDAGITAAEWKFLEKFRALDARGQSAVLSVLEHEYQAISGDGSASSFPRQA